jgi:hypothetical protein
MAFASAVCRHDNCLVVALAGDEHPHASSGHDHDAAHDYATAHHSQEDWDSVLVAKQAAAELAAAQLAAATQHHFDALDALFKAFHHNQVSECVISFSIKPCCLTIDCLSIDHELISAWCQCCLRTG